MRTLLYCATALTLGACSTGSNLPSDSGNDGVLPLTRTLGLLRWQVTPPNLGYEQAQAVTYCANLTLDGVSNWRLPSIDELRSLIVGCADRELGGACAVSDPGCLDQSCYTEASCGHCPENLGPADGCYWAPGLWGGPCVGKGSAGQDLWAFWSSSAFEPFTDQFWVVRYFGGGLFDDGVVGFSDELLPAYVRCVSDAN